MKTDPLSAILSQLFYMDSSLSSPANIEKAEQAIRDHLRTELEAALPKKPKYQAGLGMELAKDPLNAYWQGKAEAIEEIREVIRKVLGNG